MFRPNRLSFQTSTQEKSGWRGGQKPNRRILANVATPMRLGSCDGSSRTEAGLWQA